MTIGSIEEAMQYMGTRRCSNCIHGVFQGQSGRCHLNPPVLAMYRTTVNPPEEAWATTVGSTAQNRVVTDRHSLGSY